MRMAKESHRRMTEYTEGRCQMCVMLRSLWCRSMLSRLCFYVLMYGLIERKPEIYLGNGLSMVLNGLMVVGITIHAGVTF